MYILSNRISYRIKMRVSQFSLGTHGIERFKRVNQFSGFIHSEPRYYHTGCSPPSPPSQGNPFLKVQIIFQNISKNSRRRVMYTYKSNKIIHISVTMFDFRIFNIFLIIFSKATIHRPPTYTDGKGSATHEIFEIFEIKIKTENFYVKKKIKFNWTTTR